MVESLITTLTSSQPPHSHTSQLLWQHCSQPLLSLAHIAHFPPPLPPTLAALTHLTTHHSHSHQQTLSLFLDLTADSISATYVPLSLSTSVVNAFLLRLACSYLGHVIDNDVIRHHILSSNDSQLHALHVWFRYMAELDHTPSSTPTERPLLQLTCQLPKLQIVSSLLGNQTLPAEPLQLFKVLLDAMEISYVCQVYISMISH